MHALFGAVVLLLAAIGALVVLRAIGKGIAKTTSAVSVTISALGQWFAVRWHGYTLARDKSRQRKRDWQNATNAETINALVLQNAALLERLKIATVMPNVAKELMS